MNKRALIIGVIADDFTGAGDAASFLVKGGLPTVLCSGIPEQGLPEGTAAAVIALKTRTQETSSAVSDSLEAARWLLDQGADHLYFKYCSTFDSTPSGNIGPVLDAILEMTGARYSILCPALPVNGRTVSSGKLYVNGVPLDESPMKNHPLTPMWDSDIAALMAPQSKYPCINISRQELSEPDETLRRISAFGEGKDHFYVIPDYEEDDDDKQIAGLFGGLSVLSGGSGILTALAASLKKSTGDPDSVGTRTEGPAVIFAGSCSEMTRKQIAYADSHSITTMRISPIDLLSGKQDKETLWKFIEDHRGKPILLYSSDTPENVKRIQEFGADKIAGLLENTTAELALRAVEAGYTRFIVAGGETSGAVTKALGFDTFMIGESVAPGVPVMIPANRREIRLVLKSGNFGQEDFFLRALELTKSCRTAR